MTHIGNISTTVKTETADVASLLHARGGNGHAYAARNGGNGHHRRVRHQVHDGLRLAAAHAFVGAMFVREKGFTIAAAANWSGSSPTYICAMLTILDSRDEVLLDRVITGRVGVLAAAAQVKGLTKLLTAFKVATTENKVAFRKTIGDDALFDELFGNMPVSATETTTEVFVEEAE